MPAKAQIRRARFDDASLLTELTMRSKSFWRYDTSFLVDARQELEFQPNKFLPDFHVYILEEDGQMLGFCSLIPIGHETIELHDLFIEPSPHL
jgi:acetyltransferase (GNAT) family protein